MILYVHIYKKLVTQMKIDLPVLLAGNQISPITGPRCPEGSRKLGFPDYVTMAQEGGKVVSLTHRTWSSLT